MMDLNEGNVSTVGVMLWTVLCPYISQWVSQEVFVAGFGLLVVLWSAYNPNTLGIFGNGVDGASDGDELVDYTVSDDEVDDDVDVVSSDDIEDLG